MTPRVATDTAEPTATGDRTALHVHVTGIVQGVGFRPFIYRLARRERLCGWVLNSGDGVHVHVEGPTEELARFPGLIRAEAPAVSRITDIFATGAKYEGVEGFSIRASDDTTTTTTLVSPDIATCPECADELFDPRARRYHYPFVNCTNCGPRFTIIENLPYDRPSTSMGSFEMCPECAREYHDPGDRRFHAQPDACFACGPQLTWEETCHGRCLPGMLDAATVAPIPVRPHASSDARAGHIARARERSDAIVARAAQLLLHGRIVAIKGLGGYHLACDATDEDAVTSLRARKHRPSKPLAIMARDLEDVRSFCHVDEEERALLEGTVRPIVLLRRRMDAGVLANLPAHGVAFGLPEVGVMLPCTPLQHLLMAAVGGRPLVMTSGNLSDEPIVTTDEEAHSRLSAIADAFLGNDRPVRSRYDDSVVRVVMGATTVVRRARGLAPLPIDLPTGYATPEQDPHVQVLAAGPEQKATFTITRDGRAFVSQHLGDLENLETSSSWESTIALYEHLFDLRPTAIAYDLHPEYLATKWALARADEHDLPTECVQHHHAHIAAVLGEHGVSADRTSTRVVGLALDGTGMGCDGAIWGGEVLSCDTNGFTRLGHLSYLPLPGGAAAIRHPMRMAEGALIACGLRNHPGASRLQTAMASTPGAWDTVAAMVERSLNCPPTSSAGRLFDAVSALTGICTEALYDGQPAIELEAALYDGETGEIVEDPDSESASARYRLRLHAPFTDEYGAARLEAGDDRWWLLAHGTDATAVRTTPGDGGIGTDGFVIDPTPTLAAVLDDLIANVHPGIIARRFHDAFIEATVEACARAAAAIGSTRVAVSGGVLMNRYVLERIPDALRLRGLTALLPRDLPANDGCISYGQAVVALSRLTRTQSKG